MSTILISIGVMLILHRGLMFQKFYHDLPSPTIPTDVVLLIMTLYFISTAAIAWKKAAIDHDFMSHQNWIIRHVASGLWIAVQRVLLFCLFVPIHQEPVPREVQLRTFGQAAQIGWLVSVITGEYTIRYLLHNTNTKKKTP
jgi:hypothetical protein